MSSETIDLITWIGLGIIAIAILAGAVWTLISPFDFDE